MKYTLRIIPKLTSLLILIALCINAQSLHAQRKGKNKRGKDKTEEVVKKKEDKEKTIEELIKKSEKIEGLFTIYRDSIDGSTQLLITEDHIGKEFIYFSQTMDGAIDASSFRGSYGSSKVFKIEKHYNKLEFITQNTSFYFDEDSALAKSSDANISKGIMASLKIEAKDDDKGYYLIKADPLFIKETFAQIKSPDFPGQSPFAFKLGSLDADKTKITTIKNYEENTNVTTHYTYSKAAVLNGGSSAITDGRNVTIQVAHSLIAMPDNDYEIRYDDPRVGYFFTEVTDMTTTNPVPYRDLIHRWNLIKKDPTAAVSEPITPITWWMENTTPIAFRETIKEAVLEWNTAFEKAGFKNAMVVKMQPDDAEWDAGDIRYNVLRWTSSPNPPFGGYGPSFVNPRTGEILGADVMLEFVYHTNRVKYDKLYDLASSALVKPFETPMFAPDQNAFCFAADFMQENTLFGYTSLIANESTIEELEGMQREGIKELIMHEVGHTLGLNHNMKASQLFSPEQLNDAAFIKDKCLTGSVMDYTAINVADTKENQGHYFSTVVGPYDDWAIAYGYQPVSTKKELLDIASRSHQPELIFGNDADDMRSPGKGIDPRVMTGDMSNDQITYSINRIELVNSMLPKLKSKYTQNGKSYQELRQAYYTLRSNYGRAADVISRFIGGVYVDRSMAGQDATLKPYTPVSYEDQKRAMTALATYSFAPNAYDAPKELYNYIALQRRGYNFFGGPEDPKIHNVVLNYQKNILNHILHPNTLQRITDSEMYGNEYKLSEFMTDLNNSIFKEDISGAVNSFRQNLQIMYTKRLIDMIDPASDASKRYSNASKAMALYNLNKINSWVSSKTGDVATKAHKTHVEKLIKDALES